MKTPVLSARLNAIASLPRTKSQITSWAAETKFATGNHPFLKPSPLSQIES